jgi:2-oxoglutarate dehydrogenase E2 component (dihydrolipoamide succinyltransferase)
MPAAQRLIDENKLDASAIPASGPGGRILKEDVKAFLDDGAQAGKQKQAPAAKSSGDTPATSSGDRQEQVIPMTPMRKSIAAHLVKAQQTAALLTTFNEIDMTAVMDLRNQYKDGFQKKYDIKLGFMSFFTKAVIDALKQFPAVNAEVRGTDIVYKDYYDIGIAVGTGKGLVVPVLRNAERMSFAEVEKAIAGFGQKIKENKLALEDLQGGTFTITNGGIFGSLLSTPIVNPPQSAVLGMHAIQRRPVAIGEGASERVEIRPMMYVALTYDHRLVDGREAVSFLVRIKQTLEDPARMLMEV